MATKRTAGDNITPVIALVSPEIRALVDRLAVVNGTSRSAVVREALTQYVDRALAGGGKDRDAGS